MTGTDKDLDLLPTKAVYRQGDQVWIQVSGLTGPAELRVFSLGDPVLSVPVTADDIVSLGLLPVGGYGVECRSGSRRARTAVQVAEEPRSRLRYGFVVDYSPGRATESVTALVRRLHLTAIQFYDWGYRHADLRGGGDTYLDALGQPVAVETVQALVDGIQRAGADCLGYAAVYAVGDAEWPSWSHDALLTPSGNPYSLGDFLQLVDPAAPDWLAHFGAELAAAAQTLRFDGFHLDQYGYPKRATDIAGGTVDLATSFDTLLRSVSTALPGARLVFNNVNDFPTWRTTGSPQHATYIEVWPPHVTLASLGHLVDRARSLAPDRPVVVAAYQHVYDHAPVAAADTATALTMATLFTHGATQLLAGEADRILVDPYYVRNHRMEPSTAALLRRWYDFLVEHDELLMHPRSVEVTGSYAASYNEDLDVVYPSTVVTSDAAAGSVWRRIVQVGDLLVVHLINLTGQPDTLWDAAREQPGNPGRATLRMRRTGSGLPRLRLADPDRSARLQSIPMRPDGDHAVAELPDIGIWQLIVVDQPPTAAAPA